MEKSKSADKHSKERVKSVIESLLFASGQPQKITRLAKIVDAKGPVFENILLEMEQEYQVGGRGIVLLRREDEVQLATNPRNGVFVDQLIQGEMQERLSPAALEVLSIIAYRGPIIRADIEAIRGVNCTFTLRTLLLRGLIEREESQQDARVYLYRISFEFLKHLGIKRVEELPDWKTLSHDTILESLGASAEGNNKVRNVTKKPADQ